MAEYQLAEINIARIKGVNINDPIMKEFVDNLDKVNKIAENSDGFIWRLKDEDNNATNLNPYNDEQIIVNYSIWESIETLEHYMHKTFHSEFLRRRKEWFQTFGQISTAMWWIKKGEIPDLTEAMEKLDYLQKNGTSEIVFSLKQKYPKPFY
ncbi:DUF3291 domain-containing protein [Flavobacterium sp. 5]|uniref:DUF3291 domain-containing protein n=1 Tax=Flavobacterium sp. 5 TaxID=2035199 RepID=UPI000C2C3F22|nr:DUF3291 domain-containing protein [Flavobacterium sp. 5]PKB16946.1 uncharacterized protein DUF3291 [Flavobacterium sp. 5]